jgi:hypothetical protein
VTSRSVVRGHDQIHPVRAGVTRARARWGGHLLAVVGVALLAFFWFYLLHVPQTPGRMERASAQLFGRLPIWQAVASIGSLLPINPAEIVLVVVVASVLAFGAYAIAIWLAWEPDSAGVARVAVLGAVVFISLPLIALPNQESDIWDYIAFGRLTAAHHASPYDVAPSAFPEDPLYQYASPEYRQQVDNKLPVWTSVSTIFASIGGDDPITALLTYRVAFWMMNLSSLGLIAVIARRVQPNRRVAATVVWGWNPIVAIWGEKTDALMVLLLLIAALMVVRRTRIKAIIPLTLSALVKLITLPLIAVQLVMEGRRFDIGRALLSGLVALVMAAVVYVPYYRGSSLLAAHLSLLSRGGSALPDVLRPFAIVAFFAFLVWLAWTVRDDPRTILTSWGVALLAVGIFFTAPNLPWYLMSLIAAVALTVNPWLVASAVPIALASFLINAREYVLTPSFTTDAVFIPPHGTLYAGVVTLVVLAVVMRARHVRPAVP